MAARDSLAGLRTRAPKTRGTDVVQRQEKLRRVLDARADRDRHLLSLNPEDVPARALEAARERDKQRNRDTVQRRQVLGPDAKPRRFGTAPGASFFVELTPVAGASSALCEDDTTVKPGSVQHAILIGAGPVLREELRKHGAIFGWSGPTPRDPPKLNQNTHPGGDATLERYVGSRAARALL